MRIADPDMEEMHTFLQFLLSETQPKKALITPPQKKKFGNKCKHLTESTHAYLSIQAYKSVRHNFSLFTVLLFSSFAQPKSKCLLLFIICIANLMKIFICVQNVYLLIPLYHFKMIARAIKWRRGVHCGHRHRQQNRVSWVRISPGCKVF
jgi:hypothetical protein